MNSEGSTERLAERGGLRLTEDAPPLLGPAGLDLARKILLDYQPHDASQVVERERVLAFIDAHPDALLRTCAEGHLTAAAVLFDGARERVLLTHHRKLDRWLQLGGHADGDGNLVRAALREGIEESGIGDLTVDPRPIDVDVHAIPARTKSDGTHEPEHLHLDVRFCVYAPKGAREVLSDESNQLEWFGPDELEGLGLDDSVTRLFRLAFG